MHTFNGATEGSLWAFGRLGAKSMATRSPSGGKDFAFFACDTAAPSAERFSPEAWERGVGTTNGIAE